MEEMTKQAVHGSEIQEKSGKRGVLTAIMAEIMMLLTNTVSLLVIKDSTPHSNCTIQEFAAWADCFVMVWFPLSITAVLTHWLSLLP